MLRFAMPRMKAASWRRSAVAALTLLANSPGLVSAGLAAEMSVPARSRVSDDVADRVIPLNHLAADELAPLLKDVFVTTATGRTGARGSRGRQAQSIGHQGGQSLELARSGTAGLSSQVVGRPAVKIVADTRSNALWVHSTSAVFRRIGDVVKILEVPQSQVVIEATVAEIELNKQLEHGVQAFLSSMGVVTARSSTDPDPITASTPGQTNTTSGAGVVGHFSVDRGPGMTADVVLNALRSVTNTKVISTPYLTVLDRRAARLVIGDQIPFSSARTIGDPLLSAPAIGGNVMIDVKDTGLVLEVTPTIKTDNSASLTIDQRISQVNVQLAGTNDATPTISTQHIKSDILVRSGRTILLSGLIKEDVRKTDHAAIPIAIEPPFAGDLYDLYKLHSDPIIGQELIVIMTPRVIRHFSEIKMPCPTRAIAGETQPAAEGGPGLPGK